MDLVHYYEASTQEVVMDNKMQLVQKVGMYSIDRSVTELTKTGWSLYGPPFSLKDTATQAMVMVGDTVPVDPGQYKVLTRVSTVSLESQCTSLLIAGWVLYGGPFEVAGVQCQAMIFGVVPIHGAGGGGEVPQDLLQRLSLLEVSVTSTGAAAAQAETKATSAQDAIALLEVKASSALQAASSAEAKASTASEKATTADTAARQNSLDITNLKDTAVSQGAQVALHGSQILLKADLVSGKVPYEQLPEFPVGRKVNVANRAARLALPSYSDLTIAYESDTGDAWGLDASADPSISANWSPMGNARAIGVASFNGRTGNIGPQPGDYTTNLIAPTVDKQYVSEAQINTWNAKPTSTQMNQAIATQKTADDLAYESKQHSTDTYLAKTARGQNNGVAPLGSDGKVPAANLPAAPDVGALVAKADKGAVNGVAPLDAGGKVPAANLPAAVETSPSMWRVAPARVVGTWYKNDKPYAKFLNLRTAESTSTSRFINVQTRSSSTGTAFHQRSSSFAAAGSRWVQMLAVVPPGWEYMVDSFGGSTTANMEFWQETN